MQSLLINFTKLSLKISPFLSLNSSHIQPARCINRYNKATYPWMDKRKPYWIDEKSDPRVDNDLTEENSRFLSEYSVQLWDNLKKESPLAEPTWPRLAWTPGNTQRCGAIGIKLGIYPLWDKTGKKVDCTLLQILDNHAISYVPPQDIGRFASLYEMRPYSVSKSFIPSWVTQKRWGVQIVGAVSADPREFSAQWIGLFRGAGVPPKRKISRFLVSPDAALQPGTPIRAEHFRLGDYVDITARTVNRGFQGVIERWGMKGGPAARGSTKFHRKMGSAAGGGRKILRGKRMPGVMGNRYRTCRATQILGINHNYGILYVKGPVPGPVNSYCQIHDTWILPKRRLLDANPPPMPTALPEDLPQITETPLVEEEFHESIHRYDQPSITYHDPETKSDKKKKK